MDENINDWRKLSGPVVIKEHEETNFSRKFYLAKSVALFHSQIKAPNFDCQV